MSLPAARVTDMHTCPMVTGTVPHVGGPILPPGVPLVMVGGLPIGVIGNMCTCAGPPDILAMGATTVLIGGRFAVRQTDMTAHGGLVVIGLPTVLIGGATSSSSFAFSYAPKPWYASILEWLGVDMGGTDTIMYGNIAIQADPSDPAYQGKVLGDLIMIENTPTGKALMTSLNNAGGAIIRVGQSKGPRGNATYSRRSPPEIEYDADRSVSGNGAQPWQNRPPAIGLAHEMIHADHGANGNMHSGSGPNDSKPNPANPGVPPQKSLEELHTAGIPPYDTDPFTENKIRSEWPDPQTQRLWY